MKQATLHQLKIGPAECLYIYLYFFVDLHIVTGACFETSVVYEVRRNIFLVIRYYCRRFFLLKQ